MKQAKFDMGGGRKSAAVVTENEHTVWVRLNFNFRWHQIKRHKVKHRVVIK